MATVDLWNNYCEMYWVVPMLCFHSCISAALTSSWTWTAILVIYWNFCRMRLFLFTGISCVYTSISYISLVAYCCYLFIFINLLLLRNVAATEYGVKQSTHNYPEGPNQLHTKGYTQGVQGYFFSWGIYCTLHTTKWKS